ncbi:MAG: leucine-rich repeat domain-containing protein [Candidatus Thorarchaeota archaeon]
MPLTPEAILKDFMNRDLERPIAIELLLTLIDNAENLKTRIESLNTLNQIPIEDDKTFKFLEHLMISDSNEEVRNLTCQVIKNHYLSKALDLMVWALEHEESLKCIKTIITSIGVIDTKESRSVLINKLKDSHLDKNLIENIQNFPNTDLAEMLINNYIISSLKTIYGYFKYKINNFGSITELDLSNIERYSSNSNKLENFLESIFSLKDLKKCDLRFNHLTQIPATFKSSIEYLDLSYNKLARIPDLQNFKSLTTLNLKSNRIRNLPESIGSLESLKYLNLRNNLLIDVPSSVIFLSSLKTLDLHGNKLSSISVNLSNSITELELGWNSLQSVSPSLRLLKYLKKLGLGGNKLVHLPEWIGSFSSLKELDLYDNKLSEVPASIGALKSLEKLNLRNNELKILPSSVSNLNFLRVLNLSWNNFRSLPEWIGSLSSLEELNLWGNRLEILPDSFSSLTSLRILDLNFNQIKKLPPSLQQLERKIDLNIKL